MNFRQYQRVERLSDASWTLLRFGGFALPAIAIGVLSESRFPEPEAFAFIAIPEEVEAIRDIRAKVFCMDSIRMGDHAAMCFVVSLAKSISYANGDWCSTRWPGIAVPGTMADFFAARTRDHRCGSANAGGGSQTTG